MISEVLATLLSGNIPIILPQTAAPRAISSPSISPLSPISMTLKTGWMRRSNGSEHQRVLYPGLLEAESLEQRRAEGIPLHRKVIEWFDSISGELSIAPLKTIPLDR